MDLNQPQNTHPENGNSSPGVQMAVIWDMDGVIADTAPFHLKAWQKAFRARGFEVTEEDFKRNFGQRNDTIIRNLLGRDASSNEIETITEEKENAFRSSAAGKIEALPGAIELINTLSAQGYKLALASSGPRQNIELVLTSLGIKDNFQAIVSGRDVTEGKPSPQSFLLAAEKLGVSPEHCIVIEDAVAGVTAARRSGMHSIAVTNTHPAIKLKEADLVVDSLEKVSLDDLKKLIKKE
jgi:beta-phosphoglucomutase family hydrolase